MADKSVNFTFVIEPELRKAFIDLAKSQDQSAAQLIRAFMRDYLARHADALPPNSGGAANGS